MKQKIFIYFVPAVLGFSLLGTGIVSAHGFGRSSMAQLSPEEIATREQSMFQHQADLLGISVLEVKNGWAEGKTIQEIAAENNITAEQLKQKMKAAHLAQMKSHLDTLVSKGVVTQAQADQRFSTMQKMMENGKTRLKKGLPGKFHF